MLTLTGYTPDLKTTAPEDGSDPALIATVDSYRAFVPAYSNIPGEKLLAMRGDLDANADLTAGGEFAVEPQLLVQTGLAPNAGTLTTARDGAVYIGEDGGVAQMGFGGVAILEGDMQHRVGTVERRH